MKEGLLNGKVIVVTGGTGVLGATFVTRIAQAGGKVVVLGRNAAVAEERAATVNGKGGEALACVADVMNIKSLALANEQIIKKFGRIDGLVNAAGGNLPGAVVDAQSDLFGLNLDAMSEVLDLNLFGTINATQVFGKEIAKSGKGSIVNVSSMTAQKAITKVMGYSLAKASVDAYTRWFAVELANRYGDGIRMNALAPGFFITEQNRRLLTNEDESFTERGNLVIQHTPFKRFGEPDELGGALVWLLSDESRFVTGTILNIDGGFSAFGGV